MTSGEVARHLHVHPITITRWCNQGKLKFTKTASGFKIFELSEIKRFEKSWDSAAAFKYRRAVAVKLQLQSEQCVCLGGE